MLDERLADGLLYAVRAILQVVGLLRQRQAALERVNDLRLTSEVRLGTEANTSPRPAANSSRRYWAMSAGLLSAAMRSSIGCIGAMPAASTLWCPCRWRRVADQLLDAGRAGVRGGGFGDALCWRRPNARRASRSCPSWSCPTAPGWRASHLPLTKSARFTQAFLLVSRSATLKAARAAARRRPGPGLAAVAAVGSGTASAAVIDRTAGSWGYSRTTAPVDGRME